MYIPAVHSRPKVKSWLNSRKAQIKLVISQAYFPDLNPDERLSQDLRREVLKEGAATYTSRNDISDKSFSSRDRKAN
jgi:hypothetical protein